MKQGNGLTIYLKLAWRNLAAQRRQTLLSIAGASIGAALIMASIIFFQSFDESGKRWLDKHYGPIDWELRPPDNGVFFTPEELQPIQEGFQSRVLPNAPAVVWHTDIGAADGEGQPQDENLRYTVIGLESDEAVTFDPLNTLWHQPLDADELILSDAAAQAMAASPGDVLILEDHAGENRHFQVKTVVPEAGVTGYRPNSTSAGTVIMNLDAARLLAGLPEGAVTSIFVHDARAESTGPTYFPTPSPLFSVSEDKLDDYNQFEQMKLRYGTVFVLCSVTAVLAGAILMLQLLLMLADTRKEMSGVLRAIGYRRSHVRRIFGIEAALLQGLSLITGLVVGIPMGYGVILAFQWINRDWWSLVQHQTTSISPHLSPTGILLAAGIVIILNTATTGFAAYRLGRLEIVPTLRGDVPQEVRRDLRGPRVLRSLLTILAGAIVLLHLGLLLSGQASARLTQPELFSPGSAMLIFGSWLVTSVASLYLLVRLLPYVQRVIRPLLQKLGVAEVAQLLAFRYPASQVRRTFLVMLLFSSCFMLLTLVVMVTHYLNRDLAQNPYTLLGYPAYVKYQTEQERERIVMALQEEAELAPLHEQAYVLEPYMLRIGSAGVFADTEQLHFIETDATLAQSGRVPLRERSPAFTSDAEAWQAVQENPAYIIVDSKFSHGPEAWSGSFLERSLLRALQVGDRIALDIYQRPAQPGSQDFGKEPELDRTIEVQIIGFANTPRLEVYNSVFVHPEVHETFQPQGYKWPSVPDKGYVMLPLPSADVSSLQAAQRSVRGAGLDGFYAPGLVEAGEDASMMQMLWMFNGFMVLTMGIGLAGLAIVQFRAAQERSRVLAMLRCIGFSSRSVRQLLLVEGSLIGWLGLINGCLFGSIGGYLVTSLAQSSRGPLSPPLPLYYPWEIILPALGGLLLLTLLLNLAPAQRISTASPADAIRMSQD